METFKDVFIKLGDKSIVEFISRLTDRTQTYWSRSYESEENSKYLGEIAFSFKRTGDTALPDAGLSIFQKNENTWYIPNVVPLEKGQLSYKEYNEIITDFYDSCLKPVAIEFNIDIEITSDSLTVEDVVGEEAGNLLESFSLLANKSTGSSHPCDQNRWFAFIVETCKKNQYVNSSDLIRVLCKQGWSESSAQKLVIEYEFARDLIKYMEQ
ncbi:hypothetical protein [Vibrio parahaemolyticus]|uniref:hypothetical protein n=1 Tax=Vibrio parahaemolyticus TaxID=670 RepID=UPI0009B71878|nr:hypothetical protein [Vibrio parahaemolyticus]OQK29293.1 hypothetical protein XE88_c11797 [Vibrio parahaemolyticus]